MHTSGLEILGRGLGHLILEYILLFCEKGYFLHLFEKCAFFWFLKTFRNCDDKIYNLILKFRV